MQNKNWLTRYAELNNSFKTKLVFRLGGAGFFSEFNNMVLAMLYCLKNEIKFELSSKNNNFHINKGWQDFFKPFVQENSLAFNEKLNRRPHHGLKFLERKKVIAFKKIYAIDYLTQDLWNKFHHKNFEEEYFDMPTLDIKGALLPATQVIVKHIWRFQDEVQSEIDKQVKEIGLPSAYVGIHIRWGDKASEEQLYKVEDYIEFIKKKTTSKNVYIATDDIRSVLTLRKQYPEFNFYHNCPDEQKGHDQADFNQMSGDPLRKVMIDLFTDISILNQSTVFLGTFGSNISMFMVMLKGKDHCFSIDESLWRII